MQTFKSHENNEMHTIDVNNDLLSMTAAEKVDFFDEYH